MYACVPEIGGGFFEGVCPASSAAAHLCDPPPTASQFANCSFPALQQIEHGSLHTSVPLLRASPTNRFMQLSAVFSVVGPRSMMRAQPSSDVVCSTARICMACMGQCHRNPLLAGERCEESLGRRHAVARRGNEPLSALIEFGSEGSRRWTLLPSASRPLGRGADGGGQRWRDISGWRGRSLGA